jgi:hypothetical protein
MQSPRIAAEKGRRIVEVAIMALGEKVEKKRSEREKCRVQD